MKNSAMLSVFLLAVGGLVINCPIQAFEVDKAAVLVEMVKLEADQNNAQLKKFDGISSNDKKKIDFYRKQYNAYQKLAVHFCHAAQMVIDEVHFLRLKGPIVTGGANFGIDYDVSKLRKINTEFEKAIRGPKRLENPTVNRYDKLKADATKWLHAMAFNALGMEKFIGEATMVLGEIIQELYLSGFMLNAYVDFPDRAKLNYGWLNAFHADLMDYLNDFNATVAQLKKDQSEELKRFKEGAEPTEPTEYGKEYIRIARSRQR